MGLVLNLDLDFSLTQGQEFDQGSQSSYDQVRNGIQIQEGWFVSPMNDISSRFFESGQNVSRAFWRGYFPGPNRKRNGLIIHLAPTGDDTYWRRYNGFVKPLLALGVSSILLQNPFYGERKPSKKF
uniref:Uncharacterized protein n=1 Tax=Meloidogyne javanica TaxID=6303 RepID=A0A915M3H4_MELJA